MANPWFRMHAEFEDDPKVRVLPEVMQIRLVWLMCEHCKGVTLSERHRTFQWRCSEQELSETKAEFMASGFIDENWKLLNWNKRQYVSDSSTDRTRRYRERKSTSQERHRNVTVTPPDTDTDTDTEQIKPLAPSAEPLEATPAENLALIPSSSPEPPLGTIPLVDKTSFAFTQADVSGWCEAYPGVDVMGELKQMREWSIANPTHRKTKSGIRRFITSWLAKEQDKAGRPQGGFSERTTATQRSMASAAEYLKTLRDREGAGGIEYPETGGRVEGDLRRLC